MLDGRFGEQGLPMGIHGCLEGFHRGCVDSLSQQFVPKWDSSNGESKLATAGTTSLLVELIGAVALPFAGWICEDGLPGEFQQTMGNLEHGY